MHCFSKAAIVLVALFLAGSLPAWGSDLIGTWSNTDGSFSFGSDSSVQVRAQGQIYTGMWAAEGNMLMLQLNTGTMLFQAALEGDTLVLADANGTYVLARVTGEHDGDSSASPAQPSQPASDQFLSDRQFLALVEYYRQMRPDDIAAHLSRITPEQSQCFTIWESFGADLYFAACQGSHAGTLVWQSLSGPMGCAQIIGQRQETIVLSAQMGIGDPFAEGETQRLQVVNMYKCSLGLHPPDVCGTYASAQAAAGSALAEIGQTMNDNMGCTEQWEQQGNDPNTRVYLGCW